MKSIAITVLLALGSAAAFSSASGAKTITASQGNANEKSVAGVAGPAAAANRSASNRVVAHPGKKTLRKAKIKPPPPMHDPD